MKKHFKGKRYNFELIVKEEGDGYYFFSIKAICKDSGRCSSVNNTNCVLSAYDYDLDDEEKCLKMNDSTWDIRQEEVESFIGIAEFMLTNPIDLRELEDYLNLDRECGEWVDFNTKFDELFTRLKEFFNFSKPKDKKQIRILC